jgi:acyl-CoA synthetase (AMP-forming)/AMP-acid ligase II
VGRALRHHLGLKGGDVLALVMPNMPEFPLFLLGAAGVGIVTSPANPLYTHGKKNKYFMAKLKKIEDNHFSYAS